MWPAVAAPRVTNSSNADSAGAKIVSEAKPVACKPARKVELVSENEEKKTGIEDASGNSGQGTEVH